MFTNLVFLALPLNMAGEEEKVEARFPERPSSKKKDFFFFFPFLPTNKELKK
jgi:hypothetical protein